MSVLLLQRSCWWDEVLRSPSGSVDKDAALELSEATFQEAAFVEGAVNGQQLTLANL